MYIIYTPEIKTFLQSIIPAKDDAILMAKEVQRIRVAQETFHFSVQVLELGSNKLPNFRMPVYELSKPEQISVQ